MSAYLGLPYKYGWANAYFAALPVLFEAGTGTCTSIDACNAVTMCGYMQGWGWRLLSFPFNYYFVNPSHNFSGGSDYTAIYAAKQYGIPRYELMPLPDISLDGTPTYDALKRAAIAGPPSAAAYADAPNQMVTDFQAMPYDGGDLTKRRQLAQAAIDAGHPLMVDIIGQSHSVCGIDYNDGGLFVFDGRSRNAECGFYEWKSILLQYAVTGVRYANAVQGPPPQPPGVPPIIVMPPPQPQPTGNTQMLLDTIKQEANALTLGQVTQSQIDALKASVAQLVADANSTPVPVPPPTTTTLLHDITYGSSFTSQSGDVWSVGQPEQYHTPTAARIYRNGGYTGMLVTRCVETSAGQIKALRDNGSWQLWSGSGWNQTSQP